MDKSSDAIQPARLIIFDKDGTLCGGPVGAPPNTPNEQYVMPSVPQKLQKLRDNGHKLAIATNQGGVAFGFMTVEECERVLWDAVEKVGGVDEARYCPHHPGAADAPNANSEFAIECSCRKPKPGMILEIADSLGFTLDNVTYIGDSESDRMAARYAGVDFVWAEVFFEW